jgi:hypothetical protein
MTPGYTTAKPDKFRTQLLIASPPYSTLGIAATTGAAKIGHGCLRDFLVVKGDKETRTEVEKNRHRNKVGRLRNQ